MPSGQTIAIRSGCTLAALRCRACSELPVLSCRPQLIHSKATMGHGRCQTAEEVQRIVDIAQSVIDSK